MIHYLTIFFLILRRFYKKDSIRVLTGYLRLLVHSVWHHKIQLRRGTSSGTLMEKFLGFEVYFFDYGTLINQYEEIFVRQVYRTTRLKPDALIVDCGSNIGLSVLYFHRRYPHSRMIAFEPDRAVFDLLKRNTEKNSISNCVIFRTALADYSGNGKLFSPMYGKGSLNSSLVKNYGAQVTEVPVSRLSDFIHCEVDLLKIDTEGSEAAILNDLIQTHAIRKVHRIVIEFHPGLVEDSVSVYVGKLEQAGFLLQKRLPQPKSQQRNVLMHFRRRLNS